MLKLSGTALATAAAPATSAATSDSQITADMVDPENPNSAERFVSRAHELGETDEVVAAYDNLSKQQLNAVRNATERLLRTEDSGIGIFSHGGSRTEEVERTIGPKTVHETTHTLEYDLAGPSIVGVDVDSSGSDKVPLWHHKGRADLDYQNQSDEVYSWAAHDYEHSVAGKTITEETAYIQLKGDNDGSVEVLQSEIV